MELQKQLNIANGDMKTALEVEIRFWENQIAILKNTNMKNELKLKTINEAIKKYKEQYADDNNLYLNTYTTAISGLGTNMTKLSAENSDQQERINNAREEMKSLQAKAIADTDKRVNDINANIKNILQERLESKSSLKYFDGDSLIRETNKVEENINKDDEFIHELLSTEPVEITDEWGNNLPETHENHPDGIINVINKEWDDGLKTFKEKQDNNKTIIKEIATGFTKNKQKGGGGYVPFNDLKKSKDLTKEMVTLFALPYIYKKFMNIFIYYITYFNKFQNSYIIKKLENLRNSSNYKNAKGQIDSEFITIYNTIAITTETIDDFLDDLFILNNVNNMNFAKIKLLLESLEVMDENSITNLNKSNEASTFITWHNEFIIKLKNLNTLISSPTDHKITIDDLNTLIFEYASQRLPALNTIVNSEDANNNDELLYYADTRLLSVMYAIIFELAIYYKNKYEKIITHVFNDTALNENISNFFNKYNESSVISYIKIRDSFKEKEEKYQLFNPRYIYYTDKPSTGVDKDGINLSLGLENNSPSATLSLFYCNDPSEKLIIPEYYSDWKKKLTDDKSKITADDSVIEKLNYEMLTTDVVENNNEGSGSEAAGGGRGGSKGEGEGGGEGGGEDEDKNNKITVFPKYDHLFHYGHFNKILYNSNNESFGNNMTEVKNKLQNEQDVFIIGYGASGAGKTTTLIYDKNNKENQDGAVVFMLNSLANLNGDDFKEITLTINELFMAEPNETDEPNDIYPTILTKISKQAFTYDPNTKKFNCELSRHKYIAELKELNETLGNHPEWLDLFLSKEEGKGDTQIFSLSVILQLLIDKKRKVSGTTNNPQSSRSHVLTTIEFPNKIKDGPANETLKLYIGDFAGVENKFDYKSFNYSNNIEIFKNNILGCIYQLEAFEGNNTNNQNNELMTYSKEFKPIIEQTIEQIKKIDYLLDLKNINMLISSINLLNPELLGKTIMDYAFLKHPKEKYPEIYENENKNSQWSELDAGTKKNFDNSSLVYFYQLLKEPEKTGGVMKKVKEMIPMIKFLSHKDTGYNEEYTALGELKNFLRNTQDPFKPKPEPKNSKMTGKQENLTRELTVVGKKLNKYKEDLKNIDIEYGLNDPYEKLMKPGIIMETTDETFQIPHPKKNLKAKKKLIGELSSSSHISNELDNIVNTDYISDVRPVYRKVAPIRTSDNSVWAVKATDLNFGSENKIFKKICQPVILNFFENTAKYIVDEKDKLSFDVAYIKDLYKFESNNAFGRFFKNIHFVLQEDLSFKIENYEIEDTKNFTLDNNKKNLGLVSYIYNHASDFDQVLPLKQIVIGNNVSIFRDLAKEAADVATWVGKCVRELMKFFVLKREVIAENIKEDFNSKDAAERNEILGFKNYIALLKEKEEAEMHRETISVATQDKRIELESNIEETNEVILKLDEDLKQASKSEKYIEIAEAVVKRIFHIHYEVVKRTFEGLFINKSLQEMRFTMTDVLKATNELNGLDARLVPNFNSKCTNYYSNVLLENIFEPNTNTNDVNIANTNRFNIIHQILVKNKLNNSNFNGTTQSIEKSKITETLRGGIVYCVCLLLNNSYQETQNFSYINNPPKIPYIDLTEAYTELNRFRKKNINLLSKNANAKNLVFKKFYSEKDKEKNIYILTDKLKGIIEETTGFTYKDFTNKNFHIDIFENINTYMNYCYKAAVINGTISDGKIVEIDAKLIELRKLSEELTLDSVVSQEHINEILKVATDYLFLIEIMNSTSVIGTIDFTDEISKYNLSYNKCSVSQVNINYKSKQQLYSSSYDYLEKFRDIYGNKTSTVSSLAYGVHVYVPPTAKVRDNVWKKFILPSLLNLDKGSGIYKSLIKNKMKDLTIKNISGEVLKIEYDKPDEQAQQQQKYIDQKKYMDDLEKESKNGEIAKRFTKEMKEWSQEKQAKALERIHEMGEAKDLANAERKAEAAKAAEAEAAEAEEARVVEEARMAEEAEVKTRAANKIKEVKLQKLAKKEANDKKKARALENSNMKWTNAGVDPPYVKYGKPWALAPNPDFENQITALAGTKNSALFTYAKTIIRDNLWPNVKGEYFNKHNQATIETLRGGNKTKKRSKLILQQPKKIQRKYKQSLKNKIKVNHSQVNRSKVLNKTSNNKTKKYARLKLKEKKKVLKKFKQSLKN